MTPPRIATWMLKRFGSGPNIETLLGDLAEQYQQDSSATRYWRQALKAIPVSFFRDVRAHKWSVAKSLMTGWILWILAAILLFPIAHYDPYADKNAPQVSFDYVSAGPLVGSMAFMTLPAWGTSMHSPETPRSPLAAFLFAMALPAVVGAMSGWLAARWQVCAQLNPATLRLERVHRDRQTSVVLLFAGSVLFVNLLPLAFWFGPPIPFLNPLLMVNAAVSVVGILLGGGLFRDRSRVVSN